MIYKQFLSENWFELVQWTNTILTFQTVEIKNKLIYHKDKNHYQLSVNNSKLALKPRQINAV